MAFKFKLIKKCYQDASGIDYDDADFFIEENDWNDYSYYVTYHLHATPHITHKKTLYLGYIKIMLKGQKSGEYNLLRKAFSPHVVFEELPDGFVSLTQSIDVFEGLNHLLDAQQKKDFVSQMHLILSSDNDEYYAMVEGEPALEKGLLRDSSMQSFSLAKGREIMLSGETHYDLRRQEMTLKFNHVEGEVKLNFSFLPEFKSVKIPNGVMAFIGKNGSGKSTIIYELAKVLYAYPDKRFWLKEVIGSIEPQDIGISKLFLISYSPFDNFVLPGIGGEDYRLILEGLENGKGRLVFCCIRDVKSELERILDSPNDATYNELYKHVRVGDTNLKTVVMLGQECASAIRDLEVDQNRKQLWEEIASTASTMFPDIQQRMSSLVNAIDEESIINEFLSFSTGFKYFLHSLSRVVAYIEKDSMLLFDEPENHIHPPMLSFMIRALRMVLSRYNSILMIATHSPVIVQETFSENVYVVRNMGDSTEVKHPQIEAYGANIGEITSEVFDLTTDVTNYYDAYDKIYEKWEFDDEWDNMDDMLKSFRQRMNGKISHQMLSYIISKYIDEHPNEDYGGN